MSWRYIITFNTCSPDGATMLYTFFAVLHFCVHFPLNFFYLKHAVNNKKMWYTEIRLVSFFVSICQHFTFLRTATFVTCFLLLEISLFISVLM